MEAPFIATLRLDQESQDYFNCLRRAHFPPSINYLDAHITLFHKLPATEPLILQELENATRKGPFAIHVMQVYHTGFGVAFQLESKPLTQLHQYLQDAFNAWLSPQDKQRFHPHITIQNKVSPDASKALTAELQQSFKPFVAHATGIDVWIYQNGPWQHHDFFGFSKHLAAG